jgi:hypothetical protein
MAGMVAVLILRKVHRGLRAGQGEGASLQKTQRDFGSGGEPDRQSRNSGRLVVGRAVVRSVMMVMVVVRGGKSRRGEGEHAADEEELLHGYQNGTNRGGLSAEIGLRIKVVLQQTGYFTVVVRTQAGWRLQKRITRGA